MSSNRVVCRLDVQDIFLATQIKDRVLEEIASIHDDRHSIPWSIPVELARVPARGPFLGPRRDHGRSKKTKTCGCRECQHWAEYSKLLEGRPAINSCNVQPLLNHRLLVRSFMLRSVSVGSQATYSLNGRQSLGLLTKARPRVRWYSGAVLGGFRLRSMSTRCT